MRFDIPILINSACLLLLLIITPKLYAHGVDASTQHFLSANQGVGIGLHLLFLIGVVFFLFRLRDVLVYVSLFTLEHSLTLLLGVLQGFTGQRLP